MDGEGQARVFHGVDSNFQLYGTHALSSIYISEHFARFSSIFRRFPSCIAVSYLHATIELKMLVFEARERSSGCLFSVYAFSECRTRPHLLIVFLTMKIFANFIRRNESTSNKNNVAFIVVMEKRNTNRFNCSNVLHTTFESSF